MLNQIKASYGGKRPPPVATRRLLEEAEFFGRKGISGRFFTSHLSGQDGFLAVADGTSMGNTTDILVVAGGPAGRAAAIAARKKGFSVTVADGAEPPIDKACGEGLLPATLAALRELGIHAQTGDGQIFRRIRFIDGSILAEAEFTDEGGIGVRRTVLHQKMIERGKQRGVRLLWKSPATAILADGAVVGGKTVHAKWIVGAGGV